MLIKLFVSVCAVLWSAQAAHSFEDWRDLMAEGRSLHRLGRYTEAAQSFEHALTILKTSHGTQDQFASNFESLGAAYADAGLIRRAYDEYERALRAIAQFEGVDSLDYAVVFATATDLLGPSEIGKESVATLQAALARYENTGPSDGLATIRLCLAQMLIQKKKLTDAVPLLLDALADLNNRPANRPEAKVGVLNALGVVRFEQRRYEESLQLNIELLQYLKQRLGANHPLLVAGWNNVATAYVKLGRLSEAVSAYETAISLADAILDPMDQSRYSLALNYGYVLRKLGRKSEAKVYERKANEIRHDLDRQDGSGLTVSAKALRR